MSQGTAKDPALTDAQLRAAAVPVDGSGVTQPVSDAGGSLTVDGTFWQATQPVSAAALPLPAGAATSAKQPALGTAGTASADVISVQGVASMTALKTDGSAVTQPVSGTFWQATQPVSNAGTFAVQADTELTTADLDTGAGTDTRAVVGLVLAASGGGLLVGSANPVPVSDNSGSLTVDNAGTFATQAAQSGTWTVQPGNTANTTAWKVDASSVAVPVTDNSGSLTVDNGGTFAVQAAQSGTWNVGTVTTVSTLSTITNVVHVDDNSGSLTVDGTVTATIAAGAATIAKAEDAASADGDTGVPSMMVRKASPANTSGTDGDYEFLQGSAGRLWVDASGKTLTVDGSGVTQPVSGTFWQATQPVSGTVAATIAAGAAAIAKVEDAASADADVGVPAMAVRKAAPANTSGTDGDYEFLQISAGRVWASATIDAALPAGTAVIGHVIADSGSTTAVTGNVTVVQATGTNLHAVLDSGTLTTLTTLTGTTTLTPGTGAANLGKAEDAAHADGDTGVMSLAVRKNTAASTSGADGDYQPLITNTTGHLWVDASGQTLTVGTHAVTVASGGIASGAVASGAVASGAFASGSIGSGAVASGAVASGAFASGSIAAGAVAAGAASFVKLEDVASADADAGVPAMAIQKATPADTAGTDGDYAMLQMSAGRLWTAANIDKIAGTAADTNSGTKSAGTLRVVLATDQPALTNKLLVTPDANAQVDVNKIAGTAAATGNGVAGAGVLRVAIASDNTAFAVDTELPAAAALSDATANPTAPMVGAGAMLWDTVAAGWFRQPSYIRATLLASASRAANAYSTTIITYGLRQLYVYVTITVNGGSSLTFALNDSSNAYRLATATTGLTANASTAYAIGYGGIALPAAGTFIAQVWNLPLPGKVAILITTTATSTFTVDYELVP